MAMTQEEKIEIADMVRSRDRFGPVSEEELAALPGKETELWIRTKNGKTVHVFEERPENLPEQAALLLNFHGGGFLKGRTDRDRRYCCWAMEQLNCLVWDIDYSLAPENPFPFAAEEASRFSNEDGDGRGSCRLGDRLPPDGGNPADSFFLTGEHA